MATAKTPTSTKTPKPSKSKPEGEMLWVTYTTENGTVYYITTKTPQNREVYFAYDSDWNKVGNGKHPNELEKKFVDKVITKEVKKETKKETKKEVKKEKEKIQEENIETEIDYSLF